MNPTQRKQMLNDKISERVHEAAYKAFYIMYGTKATERSTIFKTLK